MLLEQLEERQLLAVRIWDGGGANTNWSSAQNWVGNVAPAQGDSLVFPAEVTQTVSVNDLPAGTRFLTIEIAGSGYDISGNAIALAGGLTANNVAGDNTFGIDLTLENAQSIIAANPGATLHITGDIHTGNLVGTTHIFGTTGLNFDGAGTTNVTGTIGGQASLSKFGGGTLILAGDNTYAGLTDVRQGVVRAASHTALGLATGDTQIQAGAALQLAGGITVAEHFAIREGGVGFGAGTDGSTLGAIRSISGENTITGHIDLSGGNNLIGVDAGSRLIVSGVIANALGSTNNLHKFGSGTLQFAGTEDNVFRGTVRVFQGTLELNKTPGKNAIGGDLFVGDFLGGDNAATVRLLGSHQIPHLNYYETALNTITVQASGVLDFNGHVDVVGNLTLFTGTTYSADVATGSGTLTLAGNLTLNAFQGSSVASPAATISGNLDIGDYYSGGGAGSGAAGRKLFAINDTQLPNIATDLHISANLSGSAAVLLQKTGGGTLGLSGNNAALASTVLMTGGVLELGSNTALGTGLVSFQDSANVVRAMGASRTVSNQVSLDGNVTFLGDDNTPGAEHLTFTGELTLTGGRTLFTMDPTQNVTLAGVIGEGIFGSQALAKSGRGTLTLTATNTFSGGLTVNADGGTLALAGQGSAQYINGLTVGIGSTLVLDNTQTVVADRLNDARGIALQGRLVLRGNADEDVTEFLGSLDTNTNTAPVIEVENTSGGAFLSVLVANSLTVGGDRPTRFIGTGLPLSESGPNRFEVTNNPGGVTHGILPQGIVISPTGRLDLTTLGSGPHGFAVISLPDSAYVTDISQASATSNVRLTSSAALTSNKTINSLLLEDGVVLSGAEAILTINTGRILFRGEGSIEVGSANINAGLIYVDAGQTAALHSNLFGNSTVQKNGPGKLLLTGDNRHTGNTLANEGTLNVQRATAFGAVSAGTFIRSNAVLELEETTFGPLAVGLEPLQVDGTGGVEHRGALQNIAGNNSWQGNVNLGGGAVNLLDALGGFPVYNSSVPYVSVSADTTFTITGDFGGNDALAKVGPGTLELAGIISRGTDRNNRILEGTLLLNNQPGVQASRGRFFVGSDLPGAPTATLRLGQSDEIIDDRRVEVFASGVFDLGGNNEVIGEGNNLILHIAPSGAGRVVIGDGGTLTLNADIQVHTIGVGNPTGASISGGTLALQPFGTIGGGFSRTFQVNDGALGDDLLITSSIVDGSGLQSAGVNKTGMGTLVYGGTTPNAYTGDTTVSEGTLVLNKGTDGAGGVNALSGRLFIGDNNVQSGFSSSDIVRWNQPHQLPDFTALVELRTTGRLELAGHTETLGTAVANNALQLQASSTIDLGGGTLVMNGNLNSNSANGAGLWTPIVAPQIINGTLDLGSVLRTFDLSGDRTELPYELEISANLRGSGGLVLTNSSTPLLRGDNSELTGDVVRTNGNIAIGSDTAPLGSGRFLANGGQISTFDGPRTLSDNSEIILTGTIAFVAGNNTAGSTTAGGGGNALRIESPVTFAANVNPVVATAGQVDFAGGIGESYTASFVRKQGFGTMIVSSTATFSGNFEVGQDSGSGIGFNRTNGGHFVLRDQGTLFNGNILIGYNGVFEIDNSGVVLNNRVADTVLVDLAGGALALTGKAGETVSEVFGQLRLRNNSTSSEVQSLVSNAPGSAATWRFASLTQETVNFGSTVKFVGRGVDLSATGANKIAVHTLPTLVNSVVPYAVLEGAGGLDFLTFANPAGLSQSDNFVTALLSGPNFSTTLAGATSTTNVKLAASEVLAGAASASALLLPGGGISVAGGGSLSLTSGLIASRGAGNVVSVNDLTLGTTEGLLFVDSGDLTVLSSISGGATASLANGGGGRLVLAGDNSYTGVVRVTGGTLRATTDLAFGTTDGGVNITYGGTLELANVNIPPELLNLVGNGESNLGSVGLRNVAGTSTWQGDINLRNNRTAIEVATGTTLIVGTNATSGAITNQGFNKIGGGTLQLAGTANNSFAATSIVWDGTVELNKSGGAIAIAMNDNTEFFVGNFAGGNDAVILRSLASDQLGPSGFRLRILSSGVFDLNGFSDTIVGRTGGGNNHDALALEIGSTGSGDVVLGGGTLRLGNTVSENGRVQVRVLAGGFPLPATISGGTLELLGTTGGQNRRILVDDSAGIEDLVISATIADGGAVGTLIKNNGGRLVLAPAAATGNTYSAPVIVEGGELLVRGTNPLGTATGGTTVNSGFSLLIDGVNSADSLNLNGGGFAGQGVVRNIAGDNTWTGNVTLAGGATLSVNSGANWDLSGVISGGNGVTKLLPGTLTYSGNSANTYTGTTLVAEGTLRLNKNNVNAIAGVLTIGNDNGGQDSDVLLLMRPNQIADNAQVQVTPSGLFDLGGHNETIGNNSATGLNFFIGPNTFPRITTGAGTLTLASGLGITVQAAGGLGTQVTTSIGATISGTVALGGNTVFNVGDVGLNIRELVLDAALTGTAGFQRSGNGIAVFSGNNSNLSGPVTINGGGGLVPGHVNALGSGTVTIPTNITASIFATDYDSGTLATFTVPNNIIINNAAGTATTLAPRGDDHLVFTGSLTNALNNNNLTANMHQAATVTVAGAINLSNDGTNRTLNINNNTFGGGAKSSLNAGTVLLTGQIVNGGGSTASNWTKGGVGLAVISNNTNSYGGITTVNGGVLLVTADNALGANGSITTNHTLVNANNTLAVAPGVSLSEWVRLEGGSFGNFGALRLMDSDTSVAETATIAGNVLFNATSWVGVDGGGANPDRLIFTGHLSSGGGQMQKVGLGEMDVAGNFDNGIAFTGAPSPWDDGILVRAGTLYFNKTGALRAISGGTMTIGDGGGGANADKLILIGSGNDQIGGNPTVEVGPSGQFLFGGATTSESIGALQINRLNSVAGTVDTTASGTLLMNGELRVRNAGFTDGNTPAATVLGNLNLNNAGRNLLAQDSYVLDAAPDFIIHALISNGSVTSTEFGTTLLTNPANAFNGATVNGQALDFNASHTHGLTYPFGGTLIPTVSGALGVGNVTINAGGRLLLDNSSGTQNYITDTATLTINGGRLEYIGHATGSTEIVNSLTLGAGNNFSTQSELVINSSAGGITELLANSLTRNGQASAQFLGIGADLGATTNSRVQVLGGGNPFVNNVLNWATVQGPAGIDLVTDADGAGAPFFIGRVTSYANDINAGGNAIVRLDGTEPAANRILTASNTIAALLLENGVTISGEHVLTMQTGGQGLIVSRGGNNALTNSRVDFGGREPIFVVADGSLEVSATLNATTTLRKEGAGNLILSGNNDQGSGAQLTGQIQINAGTLTARHSSAFGTTGGDVNIHDRAALVLDGALTILNETLRVRGTGVNNDYTGALRAINGNSVWGTGGTTINYDSTSFIHVAAESQLLLNSNIGGGGSMFKIGGGELVYQGNDNANTQVIAVNAGILTLGKTGTNRAVRNTLTIDDLGNFDAFGGSTVRYTTGAGTNIIDDGASVLINPFGRLDLNGASDTINALTVNGGMVETGTGTLTENGALTMAGGSMTGNLVLNNNLTVNDGLAATGPATIAGTLNLGGGTRTFTVNNGILPNDLTITALISNGGILKNGGNTFGGTLLLTNPDSTFAGGISLQAGTIAVGASSTGNPVSSGPLGTGPLTIAGNADNTSVTLMASGGTRTIGNAININPANTNRSFVLGGWYSTPGDDLVLAGTVTLQNNTQILVEIPTTATISGPIVETGGARTLQKNGLGTLILSGDNAFSGVFTHSAGIVRAQHANAFGSTAAGVAVTSGAVIELDNASIGNEPLSLAGNSYLNRSGGASTFTGALRNLAGYNTWGTGATAITLTATSYVGVDAGRLILNGTIAGGFGLNKVGAGTLQLAGTASNAHTGTTAVMQGTLELNKSGGALALAAPLQIGDNLGGNDSDILLSLANDQISDTTTVTINADGIWNLNGQSEGFGPYGGATNALTLVLGETFSGDLNLGAGLLTLTGHASSGGNTANVNVLPRPGISTAAPAEIFSTPGGRLDIVNGATAGSTFNVNVGPGEVELLISAPITGAAGGVIKAQTGRLVLSGDNTYGGNTAINAGVLQIRHANALGDAGANTNTTVANGAALELNLPGNNTIDNETITSLSGSGIINATVATLFNAGDRGQRAVGTGALRNLVGDNTWLGSIVLQQDNVDSIHVDAGSLTIDGVLSHTGGSNAHLLKTGPATLQLTGSAANTFNGNTYLSEGTLLLNKQGAVQAISLGDVYIGDSVGANNADRLLYASSAGPDQIGDRTLRFGRTGLLDLNDNSDTINAAIFMVVGPTLSSDIATGSGVLTSNNQFTVVNQAGTTATSPAATFSGTYDLNGGTRNIDVRDGNATVEFDIQGMIQVTGNFGINKNGQGQLRLAGNNTYTGPTNVNFGVLEVGSNNALGTSATGTTVANQAALEFNSASPLFISEALTVTGEGWNHSGLGVLRNTGPANVTLTEAISVPGTSYRNQTVFANETAGTAVTLLGTTTLLNGDLIIRGNGDFNVPGNLNLLPVSAPYIQALQGRLFFGTGLGINNVGINQLLPGGSQTPVATTDLFGPLYFPQDADASLTGIFGGVPGGANFTLVFSGMITIPTSDNYFLAITNNDDTASLWIDLDNSGTLEASEMLRNVGCCNNTGSVSAFLNAGSYQIVAAVEDTGGQSGIAARIQPSAWGAPANALSMPILATTNIGNLIKDDAGTLTVSGVNRLRETTINAGTIIANNAVSALGDRLTTVQPGANLQGNGNILGPVLVNATGVISPGVNSPGVLSTHSLTMPGTYAVTIQNGAPTAGVNYDQINVTGTVDLTGSTLALTSTRTTNIDNDAFVLILNDSNDQVVGNFNGLPEGSFLQLNGILYQITYTYNADGGFEGNDVALIDAAAQDLYWDADGDDSAAIGGTGVWDTNNFRWRAGSPTGALVIWDNTNNDRAIFAGNTGVVTIQPGGVVAGGAFFTTDAYQLQSSQLQLTSASRIEVNGGLTAAVQSTITGISGLNKFGAGTLLLQGSSNYSGTTNVFAGTLGGDGAITAPLSIESGAILAPGGTPGDFASGTVSLAAGSLFQVDINSATPVTGHDQLVVTGTVNINDATLNANLTGTYASGTVIVLIRNDGGEAVVGNFAGLPENSSIILNGQRFAVSYRYNAEAGTFNNGNDVVLIRNRPPVANNDSFTVNEDTVVNASVATNDTDPDGDTLVNATVVTPPAVGALVLSGNGAFTYTPPANFSGNVSFTYTIGDGELTSNVATVNLTIVAVADAPTLVVQPASGPQDTAIPLSIVGNLIDTDGSETLTYRISGVPTNFTLSAGTNQGGGVWTLNATQVVGLSITPAPLSRTDIILTVTAIARETSNGSTAETTATLPVDVIPVAVAPILTVGPVSGSENSIIPLNIDAQLVYNDGSEVLEVRIANVPNDAVILGGIDQGAGVWLVPAANVSTAAIRKGDNLLGNAPFNLSVTATAILLDPTANPPSASVTRLQPVTVINLPPTPTYVTASFLGDDLGPVDEVTVVPGLLVSFTVSTTDPALDHVDQPFQFVINWGNGVISPPQFATQEGQLITFSNAYGTLGTFQPTLVVRDDEGLASAPLSLATVTVARQAVIGDALYVGGTEASDRIIVSGDGSVRLNNAKLPYLWPGHRLIILGNGGNDTITASNVHFPLEFYGGAGNDYLAGGVSDDILDGGDGNDRLLGSDGYDILLGGNGSDRISGGNGGDYGLGDHMFDAESGELFQFVFGDGLFEVELPIRVGDRPGADLVNGDGGNDVLYGGPLRDRLNGGAGNDLLRGGEDSDLLDGGAGHDFLLGEDGGDGLFGRAGNDVLIGGAGYDQLTGGNGDDLLYGGDLFEGNTDEDLGDLWMLWSSSQQEDALDELLALSDDDETVDVLNGERDIDWYVLFAEDRIRTTAEARSPNRHFTIPES